MPRLTPTAHFTIMRCGLLLIFALLVAVDGAAQLTDTLGGVEVRDSRNSATSLKDNFQPGSSGLGIDSQLRRSYDQQQISTLLTMATSVFVRSYGINSLATLGFRGSSSAQSAVQWEGVPLMNGATGISDISLLPVGFSDSISIRYGGSGAMDGSGNVGGALLLQSRQSRFTQRFRTTGFLQAGYGSFNQLPLSAGIGMSGKRLELRVRLLHQSAENDFSTVDQQGRQFLTTHASMRGYGGLAELSYKLSNRDLIRAHVWLQDYQREIPRALFEQFSDKKQRDISSRYLVQYNHSGTVWQSYAKLSFIEERFRYEMPSVRINTDIRTQQIFTEAGAERGFGKWGRVLVFAPLMLSGLNSSDTQATQHRIAIAGAWRKSWIAGRLWAALNFRAENIDAETFILPGLGISWQHSESMQFKLNLQRSYRAPTLNERYYVPGGNPDLRAEQGWSGEGGYVFAKAPAAGWHFQHELTGYARLIDNWIIWLGGAIWTPHNLAQVFSRGLETNNSLERDLGDWRIRAGFGLSFTRATPTESLLPNDRSIGKQIPYMPQFTANFRLGLHWKRFDLNYLHMFADRRFTTSDESSWLPSYNAADLIGSVDIIKKPALQAQLSARNMFDTRYSVVAARPMPGRSFLAGLRLEF